MSTEPTRSIDLVPAEAGDLALYQWQPGVWLVAVIAEVDREGRATHAFYFGNPRKIEYKPVFVGRLAHVRRVGFESVKEVVQALDGWTFHDVDHATDVIRRLSRGDLNLQRALARLGRAVDELTSVLGRQHA